jgi:hypothetical protein
MSATRKSLLLVVLSMMGGCNSGSKKEVWLIPQGYVGWLRLDYAVSGAPPLAIENGRYIVRLPSSGRIRTSSANRPLIDQNEYFFEDSHGRHKIPVSVSSRYAIQNAYAFGHLGIGADRRLQFWERPRIALECVFVGSNTERKADGRNCSEWRLGDSKPPKFAHQTEGDVQ